MDTKRKSPRHSVATVVLLSSCLVAGTGFATDAAAYCGCDGKVKVKKFYDANANGVRDTGEVGLSGWKMTLESVSNSVNSTKYTGAGGITYWSVHPGNDYSVREGTPTQTNWVQSSPVDVNGDPINPQTGITVESRETTWVQFGNYCTVGSHGRTPGYWSNKNGAAKIADAPYDSAPELEMLGDLHLVDALGQDFDPANHGALSEWLRDRNANNMAFQLSGHLAAMALNVEGGFVNGNSTFVPIAGTINELMALADESLALYPYTPAGHPQRAYQEQLKNYLDTLNNNGAVVSLTPCKRTFDY